MVGFAFGLLYYELIFMNYRRYLLILDIQHIRLSVYIHMISNQLSPTP